MSFVLLLAVLGVLAGVVLVAAGRASGLPAADPDRSPTGVLPPGDVSARDVERLRFSLAFRGYRMDEVDDVLDRLTSELAERDARIAELEGRPDVGARPDRGTTEAPPASAPAAAAPPGTGPDDIGRARATED